MAERERLIEVAETYLQHGLLEHDPEKVLFADDCVRREMGMETGSNAAQLRELLAHDAYQVNKSIKDAEWVVEAPFADVRYTLEFHGMDLTMRVATRFKIANDRIELIDILFDGGPIHAAAIESTQALRTDQ